VDLSGWRFVEGIEFVFPQGVVIPARGYVVVAQDPNQLWARFGVTAFGPWKGRLDNHGETIELRDSSGKVQDRVTYGLGFPWPTVGDPPGYSIELINPAADNDLGGHWRASVAGSIQQSKRLVLNNGSPWKIMKGTGPPPTGWRDIGFDDSEWATAQAPVGYDPNIKIGTALDDMRGNYVSVFMRTSFELTNATTITGLELEALYDDGFKLWINGVHIKDVYMDSGEVPYNRTAQVTRESDNYEQISLNLPAGVLREGRNILAVHLANGHLSNSSDCFFDCRLSVVVGPPARGPTPGRPNAAFSAYIPPALRQVSHSPRQPRSGENVKITAKVTSQTGIASVNLHYQIVDPGNYIELTDTAYATNWSTLPMNDTGLDGDDQRGDSVFTVILPGEMQKHRRLVRYRIVATDRTGVTVTAPLSDDPEPNFAYFCYDGVPAWKGAVRPGITQPFTVSAQEMNRLPVYHLIAKRKSVEDCTWYDRSHGDEYFWRGTLVYDGEVYDHIRFRPRGGVWRYAMGKNMWK
ncbi:MAG: lamin tail domain-containing protein, partial [Verrucomicrobiae bacterium]|nr:lamin tail domain-containing protein [Verrucomicrobiae bacterium]